MILIAHPRVGALAVVLAVASLGGVACGSSPPPEPAIAARHRAVLRSLGEHVILPQYRAFADAASALDAATLAYANAPSDETRSAAQAAWRAAMAAWEPAEVMLIGPAAMSGSDTGAAGAMDLRDQLYSWPTTSTCRIDQETVEGHFDDVDAFESELVNVRGLDALEYLLFVEGTANTCSDIAEINAEGTWAALGDDGVIAARARYAHTLATLVARTAVTLRDAWEPTGEDFLQQLATAGAGSTVYGSAQQAMNDLAGAMLYMDVEVKGMKVGEPAGLELCLDTSCIESLEAPNASVSARNVIQNLEGLRALFLGGPPGSDNLGVDDLLAEVGAEPVRDELAAAIDAALAAMEALGTDDLREPITSNLAAVMTAYDALNEVVRLLKADLMTVLDLEPTVRISDDD